MATNRWTSKAQKQAQVNTVTPASVDATDTFTITANAKNEVFTATAATVANVTAGIPPLWNDSDEGEMNEVTAEDSTTLVTLTANEPGVPFTQTSSATGATFVTATTVANISPNDINNATNWTDGIPTAADDVVLDAGDENASLKWNLSALSAVTLTSFTRRFAYTGTIGLPEYNTNGTPYFEYRATELNLPATTRRIEQPSSDGPEQIKITDGSVQTALYIIGESQAQGRIGSEQMWWRGTHASNVVNVANGTLAISPTNLNSSVVATLRLENSTVRCGSAVTLTTITCVNSTLEINSAVTTLTVDGDGSEVRIKTSGTIGTLALNAGLAIHQSTGTITTFTPGPRSTIDYSQGSGPVTITNLVTFPAGATFNDPEGRVTFTNGWKLAAGVTLADVSLNFGAGRTFTVA